MTDKVNLQTGLLERLFTLLGIMAIAIVALNVSIQPSITPKATAASPSAGLIQLGVNGVTDTGGTSADANKLVKTTDAGVIAPELIPSVNPAEHLLLSNVFYIDQVNGVDVPGNGASTTPLATLAAAVADATGPATYIFTPGIHDGQVTFGAGDEVLLPVTLRGVTSNTTLTGVMQFDTVADTVVVIDNLQVDTVTHGGDETHDIFVHVYNNGGLTDLTRENLISLATIYSDTTAIKLPAVLNFYTYVNVDNALRIRYEPSVAADWIWADEEPDDIEAAIDLLADRHVNGTEDAQLLTWDETAGAWIVGASLDDYATITQVAQDLADELLEYYTQVAADAAFMDSSEVVTALSPYSTTTESHALFITQSELDADLVNKIVYTDTPPGTSGAAGAAGRVHLAEDFFYWYGSDGAWHRIAKGLDTGW